MLRKARWSKGDSAQFMLETQARRFIQNNEPPQIAAMMQYFLNHVADLRGQAARQEVLRILTRETTP